MFLLLSFFDQPIFALFAINIFNISLLLYLTHVSTSFP